MSGLDRFFGLKGVWFRQVFGVFSVLFSQVFGLFRVWFRQFFLLIQGFGLDRFLDYSEV